MRRLLLAAVLIALAFAISSCDSADAGSTARITARDAGAPVSVTFADVHAAATEAAGARA